MSNEKKNPLIGAFRTPVAGAPPTPAPAEPSKEAKAPVIPTQPAKAAVSPTKPDEVKKPAVPAKAQRPRMASMPLHRLLPLILTRARSPPSLSKTIKQPRMASPLCRRSHPTNLTR